MNTPRSRWKADRSTSRGHHENRRSLRYQALTLFMIVVMAGIARAAEPGDVIAASNVGLI